MINNIEATKDPVGVKRIVGYIPGQLRISRPSDGLAEPATFLETIRPRGCG
ncbi:MAG TPA: hypothetical protein VK436_06050 [Methanocella sp.]|nr:hypothetical protein [Methanocella sp.]